MIRDFFGESLCFDIIKIMTNSTPQQVFEELTRDLPHFDDGRINFTGVRKAPVLNVVVYCNDEILIVKRSQKVSAYRGLWNGISGFIDEPKPIEDFAMQELSEELSATPDAIRLAAPYEVEDREIDRVWIVYPVLAIFEKKPEIVLDWEHTDFVWIKSEDIEDYDYVKDFNVSVTKALALK
jgi:ADP-ribose pyrophosphatase YjhB (NUDIX family)